VRAKVEHPFLTLKRLWGFAKTRYRGLAKNANRAFAMLALLNVRCGLFRLHARSDHQRHADERLLEYHRRERPRNFICTQPGAVRLRRGTERLGASVLFSDKKIGDLLDPALRTQRKPAERHHLFPRKWLERNGITDLKLINQTANFAFLEWPDNADVSAQAPEKYVPVMRQRFPGAAWERMTRAHALPPSWETLPYRDFLAQRRKLMAGVIRRGFQALSGDEDIDGNPMDASGGERKAWSLIETLELTLRLLVRSKYDERWGQGADAQIRKILGDEGWNTLERNREKRERQYPLSEAGGSRDVLDYCYLGQLVQLMAAGPAWELFREMFRDKRQLEDLVKAVTPVRKR
jgi:hypothetical protein